jgi:hypothetical protein
LHYGIIPTRCRNCDSTYWNRNPVGTIGVTVTVNTQTQRMALRMNQENQQLQLKIQEMNVNAMMFQARSGIRDEILKQRLSVYTELCYLSPLSNELRVDANYLQRDLANEHYILLSKDLVVVLSEFKRDLQIFIGHERMDDIYDKNRRMRI